MLAGWMQPASTATIIAEAHAMANTCVWSPLLAAGEDCAELHVHGGPAVVRAALDALQVGWQATLVEASDELASDWPCLCT